MKSYSCKECKFTTKNRCDYFDHLNTYKHRTCVDCFKTSLSNNKENNFLNILKKMENIENKVIYEFPPDYDFLSEHKVKVYACEHCGKEFCHRQSLSRHKKGRCEHMKAEEMEEFREEFFIMKKRLEELEKQVANQQDDAKRSNLIRQYSNNCNNNTNSIIMNKQENNTINNTTNIQLLNYNKTDYDFLTDTDFIKCIMNTNHCVKTLIEKVHFNRNKPENMNVYISSIKGAFVMVYRDRKWQICDRNEQINDLFEMNELKLENWYDEYSEKYPHVIRSFQRYLRNKDENGNELINRLKKDILLMLYNKRDMIERNRKKLELKNKSKSCQ